MKDGDVGQPVQQSVSRERKMGGRLVGKKDEGRQVGKSIRSSNRKKMSSTINTEGTTQPA